MAQISSSTDPLRRWRRVQRQQRFLRAFAAIAIVTTLLLAAWGVIDPIGPDFNWGPMWR